MRKSLLLLVSIQVIGLTSIASADSAWVLWSLSRFLPSAILGSGSVTWEVLNAFEDRQSCLKEATKHISFLENHNRSRFKDKDKVIKEEYAGLTRLRLESDEISYYSAVCLPEMVDPRPREPSR